MDNNFLVNFLYHCLINFKKSNKTAICVHKLMNITTDEELKVKLTQISLQLIHRKVRFTACGLFNLDRTLIFTVN